MNQVEVLRKQIQYYSYIFSAVVLLILGQIIGDNGLAYLAIGLETVGLFAVLLGENVADVFGRMIRFRRKRELFQEVVNLKKCVFLIQMLTGFICFLAVFLLADVIAEHIFGIPNAALILRVLSPVLLLRMLVSLLTGYIQSFGAHIPIAITCVLRQVLFLVLGRMFCGNLYDYGVKVAALLKNDDFKGMYGAVGLALGIVVSEAVILIALVIFYFISDRNYDRKKCNNGLHKKEGVWENALSFYQVNGRGMGFALCKRLFPLIGLLLLVQIEDMGLYYGKYLVICSIPVLLIGARYYLLYGRLVNVIRNKNNRQTREIIQTGIQYAWSVSILAAVLLAVLAPQLVNAYFVEDFALLVPMLQHGCVLIIAIAMLAYLCLVHFAHNKCSSCLLTIVVSNVIFVLLGIFMSGRLENKTLAVVYAGEVALIVGVIVLAFVTVNQYRLQLEYIPIFVLPLICVGVAGVVVLLLGKLLTPHIGNGVFFWLGGLLGTVLYIVFLGICRVFSEKEIDRLYGKYGKIILSTIFK